jgi:hypothetical protein
VPRHLARTCLDGVSLLYRKVGGKGLRISEQVGSPVACATIACSLHARDSRGVTEACCI